MVRVHAPGATPPIVDLPAGEAHHVTRVLRLRTGDDIIVFDGQGREWLGRLAAVSRDAAAVELLHERTPVAEPPVEVTLGIGLLKGDQMDAVVSAATALGATRIAPFTSSHVALSDRARRARSVDRWTRVAVATAKQSGRAVVPAIDPPAPFEALLAGAAGGPIVCGVEPRRALAERWTPPVRPARALVLIGPEGGWSDEELEKARDAGAAHLSLGPRTLRAELAPIVMLSVLWTEWGWQ